MGFTEVLSLLAKLSLFSFMVLIALIYSTAKSGVRGGVMLIGALAVGMGAATALRAFSLVSSLSLTSLSCLIVGLCYVVIFLTPPRIGLMEKIGASLGASLLVYFTLELLKTLGIALADSFLASTSVFFILSGLALLLSARGKPRQS
ncbi:MAG: hypothetical protein DRN99_08135 [Thermoproteota archaeon]|nr:MAG: hypothetical protein DRN99_08135 [Candidatus Korarchaeota archaeon]